MTEKDGNKGRAAFFLRQGEYVAALNKQAVLESMVGTVGTDAKLRSGIDPVNQPAHYTRGKIETIDCIESVVDGYARLSAVCAGNVVKYVARAPFKGKPLEDLKKAAWYLDRLIRAVEEDQR